MRSTLSWPTSQAAVDSDAHLKRLDLLLRHARRSGIRSIIAIRILILLHASPTCISSLAEDLDISIAGVSGHAQRLAKRTLITIEIHPEDARFNTLRLHERGSLFVSTIQDILKRE